MSSKLIETHNRVQVLKAIAESNHLPADVFTTYDEPSGTFVTMVFVNDVRDYQMAVEMFSRGGLFPHTYKMEIKRKGRSL